MNREQRRAAYAEKLRDPRWQKLRLEIFERDDWTCQACLDTSSTLHVHHRWYEYGDEPWEASQQQLVTLCEQCHEIESKCRAELDAFLVRECRERLTYREVLALAMTIRNANVSLREFVESVAMSPCKALINFYRTHPLTEQERQVRDNRMELLKTMPLRWLDETR